MDEISHRNVVYIYFDNCCGHAPTHFVSNSLFHYFNMRRTGIGPYSIYQIVLQMVTLSRNFLRKLLFFFFLRKKGWGPRGGHGRFRVFKIPRINLLQ